MVSVVIALNEGNIRLGSCGTQQLSIPCPHIDLLCGVQVTQTSIVGTKGYMSYSLVAIHTGWRLATVYM